MSKPLCIDIFAGLGGWADGFLAAGYDVVGFDNHRHVYGKQRYPGQLVIQDALTIHGSQCRNAAVIVASPPCQEFSYMAMPWTLAKAKAARIRADETGEMRRKLTELFDACFRIQREASEAAGHYIPMIVENVKGAQPWVGRAPWNFGSFYLWGDVPALMPFARKAQKFSPDGTSHGAGSWFAVADSKNRGAKNNGGSWFAIGSPGQRNTGQNPDGRKVPGMNFHDYEKTGKPGRSFQSAAVDTFGWSKDTALRNNNSKSSARKMASAQIAKIPFPLAEWIARVYHPGNAVRTA